MTEISFEQLRRIALNSLDAVTARQAAIAGLAELGTRDAAEALIEVGVREDEPASILRAAGAGLAALQSGGVAVSEWDVRDLSRPAAEAFLA